MTAPPRANRAAGENVTRTAPGMSSALMAVLILSALMPLVDATIMNVATRSIATSLGAGAGSSNWIITVYLLTGAVTIPLTPWLTAQVGTTRAWQLALSVFMLGSVLSSCAWNLGSLIAFRAVQGVGGGAIMPIVQTLVVSAVGRQAMRPAMASIGVPAVIAPVLGPLCGAALIDVVGWRSVFLINVPICAVALVLGRGRTPSTRPDTARRLDLRGAALVGGGPALMLYGLTRIGDATPRAASVAFAAGLMLLVAFAVRSLRGAGTGLLDLHLFARPAFGLVMAECLIVGALFYGTLLLIPLYWEAGLGHDTVAAGVALGVQGVGALVARSAVRRFGAQVGSQTLIAAALAITAVGTVPLAFAGAADGPIGFAGLFVRGIGLGAATVVILAAAFNEAPANRAPDASALTRVMLQVGGAAGTAAVGVLASQKTLGEHSAYSVALIASVIIAAVMSLVACTAHGLRGSPGTEARV